jgi:predicted RNA-binding protein with RPS1 domain
VSFLLSFAALLDLDAILRSKTKADRTNCVDIDYSSYIVSGSMSDSRRRDWHHEHHEQHHSNRRPQPKATSPPPRPPKEGDIYEGEIVKIEKYGAFCSLLGTRYQGLIHISQLYDTRVENVADVVSVNDMVWVKVLQVEEQQQEPEQDSFSRHPRLRIKLSMKDVSQDGSRQDLGRQREQVEHAKAQLETNLNSMIGMGWLATQWRTG